MLVEFSSSDVLISIALPLNHLYYSHYWDAPQRGRPNLHKEPTHYSFHIQASLVENPLVLAKLRRKAGRFILASNSLEEQKWSAHNILREYKEQQPTERGFRFLKDPLFFAQSVFLKNTQRIMALAMLMTHIPLV